MTNENDSSKYQIKIDLNNLILEMVNKLPKRPQEVIIMRFNLDGKGVRTLDQIGKDYGVTRERVRQIEAEGISKLKAIGKDGNIDQVFDYIQEAIEDHGGIMSEDSIAEYLFGAAANSGVNRQLTLLILSLDEKIKNTKEIKVHKKIYFYNDEHVKRFRDIMNDIEKYLLEKNENLEYEKIIELANDCASKKGFSKLPPNAIKSYLSANKIIIRNILNQWGHEKWPHINPKSIKDKAYLALKKGERALHFSEIADEINKIWIQRKKKANKQTVHNELIKDKRFVLIGRGIYALKDWGYSPGTVLDVIIELLKAKGEMGQDEIIDEVLNKRKVRKNTIILNLQNKNYFEKLPNKIYKLKQ
ncbi:MAG: sigma factor-like helix-turn-helix DNA-binding protein [Candidatus Paceibacterota bacterium]|jgi:DNA-directed RNA polymerase delta subunit